MFGLLIAGCGNRTPQSSNDEILDDVTQNLNVEKINNTLDSILCRCSEEAKLRYYQDYHHRSFNLAIADYDDEFIAFEQCVDVLDQLYPGQGRDFARLIKDCTIKLYKKCAEYALSKGIIIADTKFEFGLDENGNVVIGDEMLTPDSSRFWPLEGYEAGKSQPSYDKQFVRDWLKANPDSDYLLPDDVIDKTIAKYKEAFELLTGRKFA